MTESSPSTKDLGDLKDFPARLEDFKRKVGHSSRLSKDEIASLVTFMNSYPSRWKDCVRALMSFLPRKVHGRIPYFNVFAELARRATPVVLESLSKHVVIMMKATFVYGTDHIREQLTELLASWADSNIFAESVLSRIREEFAKASAAPQKHVKSKIMEESADDREDHSNKRKSYHYVPKEGTPSSSSSQFQYRGNHNAKRHKSSSSDSDKEKRRRDKKLKKQQKRSAKKEEKRTHKRHKHKHPEHSGRVPGGLPHIAHSGGHLPIIHHGFAAQSNTSHPATNLLSQLAAHLDGQRSSPPIPAENLHKLSFALSGKQFRSRRESVIASLYSEKLKQCKTCGFRLSSEKKLQKHLDWHFSKNKMKETQLGIPRARNWYLPDKEWREDIDYTPMLFELFKDKPVVVVEVNNMPARDEQKECKICYEKFDEFFDDDKQIWMVRGVTNSSFDGEDVLVHQSCLEAQNKKLTMSQVPHMTSPKFRPLSVTHSSTENHDESSTGNNSSNGNLPPLEAADSPLRTTAATPVSPLRPPKQLKGVGCRSSPIKLDDDDDDIIVVTAPVFPANSESSSGNSFVKPLLFADLSNQGVEIVKIYDDMTGNNAGIDSKVKSDKSDSDDDIQMIEIEPQKITAAESQPVIKPQESEIQSVSVITKPETQQFSFGDQNLTHTPETVTSQKTEYEPSPIESNDVPKSPNQESSIPNLTVPESSNQESRIQSLFVPKGPTVLFEQISPS
eukprot:111860_1